MLETSNFVHGSAMWSPSLVMSEWAWSGSRKQFLHCGLRKFRHSKSSVYRWYTQLDRRRFVHDTYKTMKATRTRHGWLHMFTTHRPTLTLQLHNFDFFRTCRTALLHGNWQDFNWHDASRGPSAIAELLVLSIWSVASWRFLHIFGPDPTGKLIQCHWRVDATGNAACWTPPFAQVSIVSNTKYKLTYVDVGK